MTNPLTAESIAAALADYKNLKDAVRAYIKAEREARFAMIDPEVTKAEMLPYLQSAAAARATMEELCK